MAETDVVKSCFLLWRELFFLKKIFVYLKGRVRGAERERASVHWLTPQWLQEGQTVVEIGVLEARVVVQKVTLPATLTST